MPILHKKAVLIFLLEGGTLLSKKGVSSLKQKKYFGLNLPKKYLSGLKQEKWASPLNYAY